ncbi:MAG: Gfo/Idh/MocA family oxidoreductase [Kiritimatiellae bacterium]|nr:Gfo/Idh/MocA family oxidoreductase [Kiritimatiellia bacterium]
MKAKKVKVGIIGLGWPGREHLKGYVAAKEAELVAVCDKNEKLLAEQADTYKIPERYTDHKEMLARADIEAVSVCLPNFLHKPISADVLNAGKHAFCEKPPTLNAREAAELAALSRKKRKLLLYAFVQRFSPEAQYVRRLVDRGELGEVYFGKAGYIRTRGIPIGAGGWFVDKKRAGGGALIDIGVHPLDCVWWLMGSPKPVSVLGRAYQKFRHAVRKDITFDVDDSAFAMIRFENDATLMLECSWALFRESRGIREIAGTKGGVNLSPLSVLSERDGVMLTTTPQLKKANAFEGEVRHFCRCVLGQEKPIPTAEQGVTLMKMLDAVYQSSQTGKEVRIR